MLTAGAASAQTVASGTISGNTANTGAAWTLTGSGSNLTLTISSGSGAGKDTAVVEPGSYSPWYCYQDNIQSVVVSEDVKRISFGDLKNLQFVSLPSTLTNMDGSFNNCSNLRSIVIPKSVGGTLENTFLGCGSLIAFRVHHENATFAATNGVLFNKGGTTLIKYPNAKPNSLAKGSRAYAVPAAVADVYPTAFDGADSLETITVAGGSNFAASAGVLYKVVTEGGNNVKILWKVPEGKTGSVEIPTDCIDLGFYYFNSCKGVTAITVAAGHTEFEAADGMLFNKGKTVLFRYPEGKTGTTPNLSSYTTLTTISSGAFYGCSKLTSITLPASLDMDYNDILSESFEGCTALKTFAVPTTSTTYATSSNGEALYRINAGKAPVELVKYAAGATTTSYTVPNTVTRIASHAFRDCKNLKTVNLPNALKNFKWENVSFNGLSGLTYMSIPDGVDTIGAQIFSGCSSLGTVLLPASLKSIGAQAFSGCSGLSMVVIPNLVEHIGAQAFSGSCGLSTIYNYSTTPQAISGDVFTVQAGTLYVPEPNKNLYSNNNVWKKFTIAGMDASGDTNTSEDGGGFGWTLTGTGANLTLTVKGSREVVVPYNTYAPWYCQQDNVTTLALKDGLQTLNMGGLKNLTSVNLPTSVTNLQGAFYDCSNLLSIDLPRNVVGSLEHSFAGTGSLSAFRVHHQNPAFKATNGVLLSNDGTTLVKYPEAKGGATYEIPNTVTEVYFDAFDGASNLTSFTLATGGSVGNKYAVSDGALYAKDGANLTLWKVPEGKTTVALPANVTDIGYYYFDNCKKLTSITVDAGNASYFSEDGVLFMKENNGRGTTLLRVPEGKTASVSKVYLDVPSGTIAVSASAFNGCAGITRIDLPATLDTDPETLSESFNGCTTLSAINVAAGSSKYISIGGVLYSKDTTILIKYPAAAAATSYAIPSAVRRICEHAFSDNQKVEQITIPNSITIPTATDTIRELSWASYAVAGCLKLTSVNIPEGITRVGSGAFKGCSSLSTILIPATVTSIGAGAFEGCKSLSYLSIPAGVTEIGSQAFAGCCLDHIVNLNPVPQQLSGSVFSMADKTCTLYVPENSVASYKNSPVWKNFNIEAVKSGGILGSGTWVLSEEVPNLTLTIGGKFDVENSSIYQPWYCQQPYIKTVVFEPGVREIHLGGFTNASVLTIPETVTDMSYSLNNSSSLRSINIPQRVTGSLEYSFLGNSSLTAFRVHNANASFGTSNGVLLNKSLTTLIKYPDAKTVTTTYTIPATVTSIYHEAFDGASNLAAFALAAGAVTDYFAVSDGVLYQKKDDAKYTLLKAPEGRVGKVTIPALADDLGFYYFDNCKKITEFGVSNNHANFNVSGGALYNRSLSVLLRVPEGLTGSYYVDAKTEAIGASAFYGCNGLTIIGLQDKVSNPDNDQLSESFDGCTSLQEIRVTENNPSYIVISGVLFTKDTSVLIKYPAKRKVGIKGDVIPTRYNIPAGVKKIATFAFRDCTELDTIAIPASVKDLSWAGSTFSGNTKITTIILPENAKQIGAQTFMGCSSLRNIAIPDSVRSIGAQAFAGCTNLSAVTIPVFVAEIGSQAFAGCCLNVVTNCSVTPQPITPDVFGSLVPQQCTLRVPPRSVEAYREANVWKDYFIVAEITGTHSVTFDPHGGALTGSPSITGIRFGDTISQAQRPSDPTNGLLAFDGWYKDTLSVSAWNYSTDVVTKNITLYAGWKPACQVEFVVNGGTSVPGIKVGEGRLVPRPETDPTREQDIFTGWFKDELCTVVWDFTKDTANGVDVVTLVYAGWLNPNDEVGVVKFNTRGGSPVDSQIVLKNTPILTVAHPTKEGYNFGGWYTDTTSYTPANLWNDTTSVVTQDTTLYARWTVKQFYKVYFVLVRDTFYVYEVEANSTVSKPVDPVIAGFTFAGWYTTSDYGKPWNFATDKITKNTNIYARVFDATETFYTVFFATYDGTPVDMQKVSKGKKIVKPSNPTKTGHTFADWYRSEDYVKKWSFDSDSVTGRTVLHAKWDTTKYVITFKSGANVYRRDTVRYHTTVKRPDADPTATGKTFAGWYKGENSVGIWNFPTDVVTGNLTLYAGWVDNSATKYEVSFEPNTAGAIDKQLVANGERVKRPPTLTKEGHTFDGWYTSTNKRWNFDVDVVNVDGMTLYGKWNIRRHTVRFETEGGSPVPQREVDHKYKIEPRPGDPTKSGFLFAGWYKDNKTYWTFDADLVTEATTLYAKWISVSATMYTVFFSTGGGDGTTIIEPQLVEAKGFAIAPSTPIKSGSIFEGWYSEKNHINLWDFPNKPVSATTTLYAKWKVTDVRYYIVLDPQGGTVTPITKEVFEGQTGGALPTPKLAGNTFMYWQHDADGGSGEYKPDATLTKLGGNLLLTAVWNTNEYTVYLATNGGSPVDVKDGGAVSVLWTDTVKGVLYGKTINRLRIGETHRLGYKFAGWYRDTTAAGKELWNFEKDKVTADTTLHALWDTIVYGITYRNVEGATHANPATYTVENATVSFTAAAKPGYDFGGWYADKDLSTPFAAFAGTEARDTALYAKWTPHLYTLIFNVPNGSSVSPASKEVYFGDTIRELPMPTRTGYDFKGWWTAEQGNPGVQYGADTIYAVVTDNKIFNLHGHWEVKHFPVTFDENSGTAVGDTVVDYNTVAVEPVATAREAYKFIGWYKDNWYGRGENPDPLPAKWDFARDTVKKETTLYAAWAPVAYPIIYMEDAKNNGVDVEMNAANNPGNPNSFTIEQNVVLAKAVKPGYEFEGWYSDKSRAPATQVTAILAGSVDSITLYALWTPITYTIGFNAGEGGVASRPFQKVVFNTTVDSVSNVSASRAGYWFRGWYTRPNGAGQLYENDTVHTIPEDITLHAKWEKSTYTVTFNCADATANTDACDATPKSDYQYGDLVAQPTVEPKLGAHAFLHWYTIWYNPDKGGPDSTEWDFSTSAVTRDTTIYAKFISDNLVIWTVNFYDEYNGKILHTRKIVNNGELGNSLPQETPSKTGSKFKEWNTGSSCGGAKVTETTKITSDVSFYACWETGSAMYFLNTDNGGNISGIPYITVEYGKEFGDKLVTPASTGCAEFLGWFANQDPSNRGKQYIASSKCDTVTTGLQNVIIYAHWKKMQYVVTYDAGGGSSVEPDTVDCDTKAAKPANPTRKGYKFGNSWHTEKSLSNTSAWSFDNNSVTRSMTLYAKWDTVTYSITYADALGGVHSNPTKYNVESGFALQSAVKTGYTFKGWRSQPSNTLVVAIFRGDTGNVALRAEWEPITYMLSFNPQGGQVSSPSQPATYGATLDSLPTPTREGYTFSGWYTQPNGAGTKYETTTTYSVAANTPLYAQWTIVSSYTVTLKKHDGTDANADVKTGVTYNTLISAPDADPARAGYAFTGWYDDTLSVAPWIFTKNRVTRDTTLWAMWRIEEYAITYHLNGGANAAANPVTFNIDSPAITLQAPVKAGHIFGGWYSDGGFSGAPVTVIAAKSTGSKDLYAKWRKIHTVTFAADGGAPAPPVRYIADGDTVLQPAALTKIGYTFEEWYTKSAGGGVPTWSFAANGSKVTQDTTLYAKWESITLTVSFAQNATNGGGTTVVTNINGMPEEVSHIPYGTKATLPKPTSDNYSFIGWNTVADGSGKMYTDDSVINPVPVPANNTLTLRARWELKKHAVSFVTGVEGAAAPQTVKHGDTVAIPDVSGLWKDGHHLAGWHSGSLSGAEWNFHTGKVTSPTTLYAKWEPDLYKVALNRKDGSPTPDTVHDVPYNSTLTGAYAPPTPARTGYTFIGWYTDGAAESHPWDITNDRVTDHMTLYAGWVQTGNTTGEATIVFIANGGSVSEPKKVLMVDSSLNGQLLTPTRTGYAFEGWYRNIDLTGSAFLDTGKFEGPAGAAIMLYAKWAPKSYQVTFDAGSGTLSGSSTLTVQYDAPLGAGIPSAQQAGHTFTGWDTVQTGSGATFSAATVYKLDKDTTLYARYQVRDYSVRFATNGGTDVAPIRVSYNDKLDSASIATTLKGYTLEGWYANAQLTPAGRWKFKTVDDTSRVTQDTVLYAKWTLATYMLTYATNGGDGPTIQPVFIHYGDRLSAQTTTRTGHDFVEWNTKQEGNGKSYYPSYSVYDTAANLTLYAKWKPKSYTVTFASNGGTAVAPITVSYGSTISKPNNPSKTGYNFVDAWYVDKNTLSTGWVFGAGGTQVTQDTTLYAKWTGKSTYLMFNKNGWIDIPDNNVVNNLPVTYGEVVTGLPNPGTIGGYRFTGWNEATDGTGAWYRGDTTVLRNNTTNNIVVYAQRDTLRYTVRFATNGANETLADTLVKYKNKVTRPAALTKTGYAFGAWYADKELTTAWVFNTATVVQDTTLYATWTPNKHKVAINKKDGSSVDTIRDVDYNATLSGKLSDPALREGYQFIGWYTEENWKNVWTVATSKVTGDITLFARWVASSATTTTATIVLNTNGGSVSSTEKEVNNGEKIGWLSIPALKGQTFGGWYYDVNFGSLCDTTANYSKGAGTVTVLYAKWTPTEYTVTFDGNTGALSHSNTVTTRYNALLNANGNVPTAAKAGHTFTGWSTLAGGGGKTYTQYAVYDTTVNLTLYAQYTVNKYTVTFVTSGGSSVAQQSVSYEGYVDSTVLNGVTRTGYSLSSWNIKAGDRWIFKTCKVTQDTTLYAVWQGRQYQLIYQTYYNVGDGINTDKNVTYGSPVGALLGKGDVWREGFIFAGWNTAQNNRTGTWYRDTTVYKVVGNTTIHAQWDTVYVTATFVTRSSVAAPSPQTVAYNRKVSNQTPARTGYNLNGWCTDTTDAENTKWSFTGMNLTQDTTLYAMWTPKSYTVSINLHGGSISGNITGVTVPYGDTIGNRLPEPTLAGSEFMGWFTDNDVWKKPWSLSANRVTEENITLHARWAVTSSNTALLLFHYQGGAEGISNLTVDLNQPIGDGKLPTSTRKGYKFTGWNTNPGGGGTAYDKTTTPTSVANVDLYAQWQRVAYTITYAEVTSSEHSNPSTYSVESNGITLTPAAKTSYKFIRWYKVEGGQKVTVADIPAGDTGNLALTAEWKALYTVTFTDGGSTYLERSIANGDTVSKPADPVKAGHTLLGWYKGDGSAWDFSASTVAGNTTLTAKWKPIDYLLIFNGNGGAPARPSQTVHYDSAVKALPTATREGYAFKEWNAAQNGLGTKYSETTKYAATQNTTVYAQWDTAMCTVIFKYESGVADDIKKVKYTYLVAKPNDPSTKQGYSFKGWYEDTTSAQGWRFDKDRVMRDTTTLWAKWELATYTITYYSNLPDDLKPELAEVNINPTEYTVRDVAFSLVETGISIPNYKFDGWYDNGNYAGSKLNPANSVLPLGKTSNQSFWAKFRKIHKVTFNTKGADGGSSNPPVRQIADGDTVSRPLPNPTKTGYHFKDNGQGNPWYSNAASPTSWDFVTSKVTRDTVIFIQWEATDYSLLYDVNGGNAITDASKKSKIVHHNEKVGSLHTSSDVTRSHYDLIGWNDDADGKGMWYTDTTTYKMAYVVSGTNTYIYAQWKKKKYVVTFDADGAEALAPDTVEYDNLVSAAAKAAAEALTKAGHTLDGWWINGNFTVPSDKWNFGSGKVDKNVTLKAKWDVKTFKVVFDSDGGTMAGDTTVSYNALISHREPTKPGCDFGGWWTSKWDKTWDFTAGVTEDKLNATEGGERILKLYARWFDRGSTVTRYTLMFDANGGVLVGNNNINVYRDSIIDKNNNLLPSAARKGYNFMGWYENTAGTGTQYTAATKYPVSSNTTVYAKWDTVKYKITFNEIGGINETLTNPTLYTINDGEMSLPIVSKSSSTFKGWWSSSLQNAYPIPVVQASWAVDTNLYARWATKRNATFNADGGIPAPSTPQEVAEGDTIVKPSPDPAKAGFTFKGWYSGSTKWNFAAKVGTSDVTLVANWDTVKYDIIFLGNGGAVPSGSETRKALYGKPIGTLPTPTWDGHTFNGWFTAPTGGTKWADGQSYTTTNLVTQLYAQWTAVTYTVTFNSRGGAPVGSLTGVLHSATVTEPTPPTFTGWMFDGWYTATTVSDTVDWPESAKWSFAKDRVTGNVTLFARWTAKLTVTYDANGGTLNSPSSVEVDRGATLSEPTKPTYAGYKLVGWYKGAVADNILWNFSTPVTESMTLVAKWINENVTTYKVTFNARGGSTVPQQEVEENSTATVPTPNPTKTGYEFGTWVTDTLNASGTEYSFSTSVKGNVTLFATWSIKKYTVTFDFDNGNDDVYRLENVPYNSKVTSAAAEASASFSKSGYTFANGWYYKEGTNNVTWDFATKTVTDNTTLYATWKQDAAEGTTVSVIFNANGGVLKSAADIQRTLTAGDPIGELPEVNYVGYFFKGWFPSETGGAAWTKESVVANSTTLFARWEADPSYSPTVTYYTVSLDAQGGMVKPISQKVTIGQPTGALPDPDDRAGYDFK
jgi:uncharacterized repeat protein (TIGR02543 family)